jgi:hypothetical protein
MLQQCSSTSTCMRTRIVMEEHSTGCQKSTPFIPNDPMQNLDCKQSNDVMTDELEKKLEGSGHCIIEVLSRHFSEGLRKKRKSCRLQVYIFTIYYSAWVQVIKEFFSESRRFIFMLARKPHCAQSRARTIPELSGCYSIIQLFNTAKMNSRYSTLFVTNFP